MVSHFVDSSNTVLAVIVFLEIQFNFIELFTFSKGISQSALPYRRSVPSWLKLNAEDVKEQIKKLGKKGMTPSQIGELLRLCCIIWTIFHLQ